jgi:hypothetical protein
VKIAKTCTGERLDLGESDDLSNPCRADAQIDPDRIPNHSVGSREAVVRSRRRGFADSVDSIRVSFASDEEREAGRESAHLRG